MSAHAGARNTALYGRQLDTSDYLFIFIRNFTLARIVKHFVPGIFRCRERKTNILCKSNISNSEHDSLNIH